MQNSKEINVIIEEIMVFKKKMFSLLDRYNDIDLNPDSIWIETYPEGLLTLCSVNNLEEIKEPGKPVGVFYYDNPLSEKVEKTVLYYPKDIKPQTLKPKRALSIRSKLMYSTSASSRSMPKGSDCWIEDGYYNPHCPPKSDNVIVIGCYADLVFYKFEGAKYIIPCHQTI